MPPARHDHIIQLPQTAPVNSAPDVRKVAQEWLNKLEAILTAGEPSRLDAVFHKDSWWRDILALQWDFRTIRGRERVEEFLRQNQQLVQLSSLRLQDTGHFQPKLEVVKKDTGFAWICSLFHFETRFGRGSGVLRLTLEKPGVWKAFAVYTTLQELKGFEEPLGTRRVYGTLDSMPGGVAGGTWRERRQRQLDFVDEEPQVLLIGAGKSPISISLLDGLQIKILRPGRTEFGRPIAIARYLNSDHRQE